MKSKSLALALVGAAFSLSASALQVNTYTAGFQKIDGGTYRIEGFGRGSSAGAATTPLATSPGIEPFYDTWNLDPTEIAPGQYSFSSLPVDATGGLTFSSVTLSSYDSSGHRNTFLFSLNADGTEAVGSGQFTVLSTCPVQSCIWIDVVGTQPIGSTLAGYGGTTIVTAVPEPGTAALWAIGLLALGGGALRRRSAAVVAVH